MLSGLPASGKSTRAKEIVDGGGNFKRVSKDNLRTMLHFNKWNGRNEELTKDVEGIIASALLKAGFNVVVDDTNMGPKHLDWWKYLAKLAEASFEHEAIETPWDECVKRDKDSRREVPVGEAVIVQMAMQYGLYPQPKKAYVICDLDGTLSDTTGRLHFLRSTCEYCGGDGRDGKPCVLTNQEKKDGWKAEHQKRDWGGFFGRISGDPVREDVKQQLKDFMKDGYEIVFMSGRPENYRTASEAWLAEHWGLPYATLIMRKENDKRPDTDVKKQLFERYLKQFPIHKVIDDRPSVIRMWREEGLDVVDVGKGVEF